MTPLIIASRTFKEKSVFATILRRYYFGSFYLYHETTRYLKRNIRGTCATRETWRAFLNAEKDLPKVNSTVVFFMHFDWSGLNEFLQISGM